MFDFMNDVEWLERLSIPRTFFSKKTKMYRYFFRSLLQKIDSALIFKGLPDTKENFWPEDYFKFLLWATGKVAVFETEQWGLSYSLVTSMSGFNFYFEPTKISVMNPLYTNILTLHKDVEVIHLTPDFKGIFDIIDFYADKLANLATAIHVGITNAKLPLIIAANSKSESELIKAVYDNIQQGETLVVPKNKLNSGEVLPRKELFSTWSQDFKQTYIVSELLENFQTILDSFYMEIGLPTILNDKKAHTLNQEADFQSAQSQARIACWVANLNESFKRVEETFGLHLEVEYAQNDTETDDNVSEQDKQASK